MHKWQPKDSFNVKNFFTGILGNNPDNDTKKCVKELIVTVLKLEYGR